MGYASKNREYRLQEWKTFRAEMLEREGHQCSHCGRTSNDGVVLQIHHRSYVPGRKPWEYNYNDCEVLCKGCHAAEHGLLRPSIGWEYLGEDDLGDLCGTCDVCGNALRYVFYIAHRNWEPIEVGTDCCDNLTSTKIASNKKDSLTRYNNRLARFMVSKRWSLKNGKYTIRQKRITVSIVHVDGTVRLCIDGTTGSRKHESVRAAKQAAFDFIESGEADKWIARQQKSQAKPNARR